MRALSWVLSILGTLVLVIYFGVPFGLDLAHVTGVIDYRSLGAPELTALKAESRHWFSFLVAGGNLAAVIAALVCLVRRKPAAVGFLAITLVYLAVELLVWAFVGRESGIGIQDAALALMPLAFVLGVVALARLGLRRTTR